MAGDLRTALDAFDGKHVAPLKALSRQAATADQGALADEVTGPRGVAATWVLKAIAEQGKLRSSIARSVFGELAGLSSWEAILHVLQLVQHAPEEAAEHADVIRDLLDHDKTLVRVWALDAFARVGPHRDAKRLVMEALDAKQASMRARARQLVSRFE
ncbi:MAG: hypothetical protein AAGK78_10270 [Planctomycetota bacterium]